MGFAGIVLRPQLIGQQLYLIKLYGKLFATRKSPYHMLQTVNYVYYRNKEAVTGLNSIL